MAKSPVVKLVERVWHHLCGLLFLLEHFWLAVDSILSSPLITPLVLWLYDWLCFFHHLYIYRREIKFAVLLTIGVKLLPLSLEIDLHFGPVWIYIASTSLFTWMIAIAAHLAPKSEPSLDHLDVEAETIVEVPEIIEALKRHWSGETLVNPGQTPSPKAPEPKAKRSFSKKLGGFGKKFKKRLSLPKKWKKGDAHILPGPLHESPLSSPDNEHSNPLTRTNTPGNSLNGPLFIDVPKKSKASKGPVTGRPASSDKNPREKMLSDDEWRQACKQEALADYAVRFPEAPDRSPVVKHLTLAEILSWGVARKMKRVRGGDCQ